MLEIKIEFLAVPVSIYRGLVFIYKVEACREYIDLNTNISYEISDQINRNRVLCYFYQVLMCSTSGSMELFSRVMPSVTKAKRYFWSSLLLLF